MAMEKKARHLVGYVSQRMERGALPGIDDVVESGISSFPELAFHFMDLMLEFYQTEPVDEKLDSQYEAALVLFEDCLIKLRFAQERRRSWAPDMVEKLQEQIAANVFVPEVGHLLQQDILDAFKDAGLEILPVIKSANHDLLEYYSRFGNRFEAPDLQDLIKGLEDEGVVNVYDIADLFLPQLRLLPDDEDQLRILGFLATSESERMREVVGLMLLHPDPRVRRLVPSMLIHSAEAGLVSPITLSRMITVRNWLPENERPALDNAIKTIRKARVLCAPLERAEIISISSSCLDGAGTMAIWLFGKSEDGLFASHILTRMELGVREIWFRNLDDESEIASLDTPPDRELPHFNVSPAYLDAMISHFISEGHQNNLLPPMELLRIAEMLGGGRWGPFPLDEEILLGADTHDASLLSGFVEDSGVWGMEHGLARSWFEDDELVDVILQDMTVDLDTIDSPAIFEEAIMEKVLEPKRKQWSVRFLITAWWLKGAVPEPLPGWRKFLALAQKVQEGLPFNQIPLMECVAKQTLYATMLRLSKMAMESMDENDESFLPQLNRNPEQ